MTKQQATGLIKQAQTMVTRHTPEILTGIGIVGMVATTVMAVKATPKATQLIADRMYDEEVESLTPLEKIQTTWKCYIPAAVTGVTSIACLIGASSVNVRRSAALATAYEISRTALADYKEKVVETVGEKKEQTIREKVAKKKLERDPVQNKEVIVTEKGDTLCYDGVFGRYFRSDINAIKQAINVVNRNVVTDMYASLNSFYDELDLKHTSIGDDLGWNIDDGTIDVEFSSQLAEDNTPCLVIEYNVAPRYGYSNFA